MKVKLAVICDYANVSREGKASIFGIFTNINAPKFPTKYLLMHLVAMLEFPRAEKGTTKNIVVRLVDADGKKIMELKSQLKLPDEIPSQETSIGTNFIIGLNNITFPHPGNYEFSILVNDEERATVPLRLTLIKVNPPSTP